MGVTSDVEASRSTYTYTQRVIKKLPHNFVSTPLVAKKYRKNQTTTKIVPRMDYFF